MAKTTSKTVKATNIEATETVVENGQTVTENTLQETTLVETIVKTVQDNAIAHDVVEVNASTVPAIEQTEAKVEEVQTEATEAKVEEAANAEVKTEAEAVVQVAKGTARNDANEEIYNYAGWSILKGKYTPRFATKLAERIAILTRNGHTDINFIELPNAMTKLEAINYLLDTKADGDNVDIMHALDAEKQRLQAKVDKAIAKAEKAKIKASKNDALIKTAIVQIPQKETA